MRRARTGPYRSQNQPQCSATTETTYLLTSSIFSISSSANQSFFHLHPSYRLTRQVRPHILLCWCPLPKTSGQFRFQPIKSSETSCVVGVTFTMIDKAFIEIHLKAWCGLCTATPFCQLHSLCGVCRHHGYGLLPELGRGSSHAV